MEWWIGGTATALATISLLSWRFGPKNAGETHGSSRWSTPFELQVAGHFKKSGIRVGDIAGAQSVFYTGAHALTFGVPGSGKGTSAILPNLLERKFIFLIDPGGENTAIAAKRWRDQGYAFSCINPFGVFAAQPWALPRNGFNPLAFLDPASDALATDAKALAELLIPKSAHESGSSRFFRNTAVNAMQGMIIHLITAEPPARRHLGTLFDYLYADAKGWDRLIAAMKQSEAAGGLVRAQGNRIERVEAQAEEEFSGMMSTMQEGLGFVADPVIRSLLARNDTDFSALKGMGAGRNGAVVSVVLPLEYLETHGAILRMAMFCGILTMQREPRPSENVLFVIDEAAALGHIDAFPSWLATLRKYNVSIWSIWQSLAQIVTLYGASAQVIVGNCGLKQFLSVGDLDTAIFTEKMLGLTTVQTVTMSGSGQRSLSAGQRPLRFADELFRLKDNAQIVLVNNRNPLRLKKTPYWKRPGFAGRYHPNPFIRKDTPQRTLLDEAASLWGALYMLAVCAMTPTPFFALLYLLALGHGALWLYGLAV